MHVRGRSAAAVIGLGSMLVVAGCGGDPSGGTLDVIDGGSMTVGSASPTAPSGVPPTVGTTLAPGTAGSGFVSIGVQVASAGIAETISLDRGTVPAAALDRVSLDATCSPLDGATAAGDAVVSVVDLRRLGASRLVSAVLRFGAVTPGEQAMTLELGGADQVTTTYTGTVHVAPDGLSGTFEGADATGAPATGSFACAAQAIVATTAPPPLDAGEVVPEDTGA